LKAAAAPTDSPQPSQDHRATARLIYRHLRQMKTPELPAELVKRRYTGWTNFAAVLAASDGWLQLCATRLTVRALTREERGR